MGRVNYRVVQRGDHGGMALKSSWSSLSLSMAQLGLTPTYSGHFTFHNLSTDTAYEVTLATENSEGWSEESPVFTFRTKEEDLDPPMLKLQPDTEKVFNGASSILYNLHIVTMCYFSY